MFHNQTPNRRVRPQHHGSPTYSYSEGSDRKKEERSHLSTDSQRSLNDNLRRMADLRSVAEDIKSTLTSAITDLRDEVRAISLRVDEVEASTQKQGCDLR